MILQIVLTGVLALGIPLQSLAQAQAQAPAASPGAAVTSAAVPPADQALLAAAQLDALLAPIALYPDTLLAQVLMASTYPLEVVQAQRWAAENKKLKGDALKSAAEKQAWDDSIKALVATPSVLDMMSKNLEWTQKLGDAVLAQEPDVMDAVQRMRSRAYDNKKLSSGAQQTVTVQQEGPRRTIAIAPTAPDTVYVPYYEPSVVYGSWPYPEYPPYYFPYTGYIATGVIATGLAFGAAYALGRWATGGYWGGNINWNNNNININRDRVSHWQHNPQHRHGVRYGNSSVQQRFANTSRPGSDGRMDFRGRDGNQVIQRPDRPDRPDRPNVGDGNRPDRGQGANRPERPDRPNAGNRPNAGGGSARPDRGPGNRPATADRARQNRPNAQRPSQRPAQANRPGGNVNRPAPRRDNAFGNMQPGRAASLQSQRGRASFAHAGPRMGGGYGGGPRAGGFHGGGARMGGGGFGGGGRGGGGRGGGGRRSDIALKDHIVELGRLGSGIGFYRFAYRGSDRRYVGVMAQEVQEVAPDAVTRGADGFLRVYYERIGVRFQTYDQWRAAGSHVPTGTIRHECVATAGCRVTVPEMSGGTLP